MRSDDPQSNLLRRHNANRVVGSRTRRRIALNGHGRMAWRDVSERVVNVLMLKRAIGSACLAASACRHVRLLNRGMKNKHSAYVDG